MPSNVTVVEKTRADVRRVVIHNKITSIAADAFRDWTSLEEVVFAGRSQLERIGAYAFAGAGLRKFVAPRSLKTIRAGAFMGCKSLKEVRLNEGLESVGGDGEGVFQDSGVETIYVPSTLQRMRRGTFACCANLRRVKVAEGCRISMKYYVPKTVEIVIVPSQVLPLAEESSDTPEAPDEMAFRANAEEHNETQ